MSSTTFQTSTTISAHIDDDVPDIVIHTPQTAPQIRDVIHASPHLVDAFMAIAFRTGDYEDDLKDSACLGGVWAVPEPYKDDNEPDIMRRMRGGCTFHGGRLFGDLDLPERQRKALTARDFLFH